jgi:thioredoxin 1
MTVEISRENFEEVSSRPGIVLIDCWASWCRGCGDFARSFSQAAQRHPAHLFGTLDTESQKELRDDLGIRNIPSLLLYRDGVLLFNQPGNFDEAALDSIVSQAESLDMELVRAELAAEQSGSAD